MLSNTARIAKNTMMLYFRQILIMLVNLYVMRVVLEILGTEDYGIFNLVGSVVVLFTFLNTAMTNATQRFLSFALGRNDMEQARNVYSVSVIIYVLIAVLVLVLAQTLGVWFFYTWLNIPPERQGAAFVVYQFSIAAMLVSILQVPYRATIIAHEKMSFFATLSIFEAAFRLSIVFILPFILFDKLMTYAFLICITVTVIFLIHKVYCNRTFEIAQFRYCKDRKLFRQLFEFSGWNVFSGFAMISKDQGTNILINIFHGVSVNAAMGIATQVNSMIYQFVSNFQTAFNPQIIKSYSAKNFDYFMRLIFRTSKISFCLLFFFVLPLYINADFVFRIWLINIPEYVVIFTQLILLSSLIIAISAPLVMSIQATGDIKRHELIRSCFIFFNIPISLLFLWIGFSPVWILAIRVGVDVLLFIWRIFFLGKKIKFPIFSFFREVIVPVFIIAGVSAAMAFLLHGLFIDDWSKLIVSSMVSTVSIGCLMYWVGLNRKERFILKNWIKKRIKIEDSIR